MIASISKLCVSFSINYGIILFVLWHFPQPLHILWEMWPYVQLDFSCWNNFSKTAVLRIPEDGNAVAISHTHTRFPKYLESLKLLMPAALTSKGSRRVAWKASVLVYERVFVQTRGQGEWKVHTHSHTHVTALKPANRGEAKHTTTCRHWHTQSDTHEQLNGLEMGGNSYKSAISLQSKN